MPSKKRENINNKQNSNISLDFYFIFLVYSYVHTMLGSFHPYH
jgi:hypothetical protein